jgi:hypothetical protein
MLDFLRDPLWQFIGAVLALVGIVVAVVIYLRQRQTAQLGWQALSVTPLLSVNDELRGQIKIMLNDKPIDQVHLILLRLINIGTAPIRTADYERPIQITFGKTTIILNAAVIRTNDPSLQVTIKASVR